MRATILEKGPTVRRAILLAVVFLTPIAVLRGANDQVNVPKLSLLMVGVALVLGLRVIEGLQGADLASLKRLAIPAAALTVPLLVGWLFSPYKSYALFGFYARWQGLIPYLVIALFGVLLADAFAGRAREIAWALVSSAALVGTYACIQRFGLDPFDWLRPGGDPNEAVSMLGNPNFTGGFLGIVIPISLGLALTESRRSLAIGFAALVGAGLLVSFSQGGWGAAVAGGAIVLGFALAERWRHALRAAAMVASVVAAIAIGLVALSAVGVGTSIVPGTAYIRGEAWTSAAAMTLDHPLVGRGPNVFAIEGVQYRSESNGFRAGYNFPDDPHSVFLSLTAAAGALGAVGFVLFLWWIIRTGRDLGSPSLLTAGFLGAVIAYVIQSLVSIDEVAIRVALWTSLAGLVTSSLPRDQEGLRHLSKKDRARIRSQGTSNPIAVFATAVIGLAAAWWSVSYLIADVRVWQGTQLAEGSAPAPAEIEFERARSFRDDVEYKATEGEYMARAAFSDDEPDRERYEEALASFSYLDGFPHLLHMLRYAEALDLGTAFGSDFDERALAVFDEMSSLDPHNPMIHAGAADSLIELGRADEALERLRPYVDVVDPQRRPQFFAVLALAQVVSGDEESAVLTLERLDEDDLDLPHARTAQELLEEGQ